MRRSTGCLVLVGVAGLLFTAGCGYGRAAAEVANAGKVVMMAQELGPTTTQSTGEHLHTINTVIDQDARAFFDDLDLLYQTERPTRLTRWIER